MNIYTFDLVINFLLVLFPLFLWQMFYLLHYIYKFGWVERWMFAVFPVLSLIMCMTFPIVFIEPLLLDLRRIPLILGALYGGYKVALLLLSVVITHRYLIGGEAFYNSFFILILTAVCAGLMSKYYLKMPLKMKILTSSVLIVLSLFFSTLFSTQVFDVAMVMNIRLEHLLINVIGMVISTLLTEVILINFALLRKSMKAEKMEVASHLAASISHEVGNPLTATKGFIQLLSDEKIPFETRKDYLEIAAQELDQAIDIIDDYLIFAKPAPKEKEKIFIFEEIQYVVKNLTPLARINNIKINISLLENRDCFVLGEQNKFGQCLANILKNAIESMPEGGEIQIALDYEQASTITLTIKDEGIGMTPQQIDRIGEPYFTTKENGTGLGMMVSFSVIQGMGGKIKVESGEGKGTYFSITLPKYTQQNK
ncbi:HAMP domain-containing sensor histidine kinase [Domibacillus sp. DTU_2020_1001157_1_SI_ALB_TIR_016]|uniref:HAMP domain-containing sensor histidine kinase n=1 Tax=Domibacillus sp. DTU_2020_1001157_1_SI_ALB_TIR_016 TaxID=3077789 RepID=UPI0028E47230|nr:HAMP domain-containing sensor histidine kinase [Domibacillus sp. DTU_2020_1001157_1_SI_ALB_TIR_016]WNS78569.1 HAMP domain-containing sensor histidine kinase [Domibacillus sp. DTU_2020_1001157_1_SI_ALB_TIR_016]